MRSVVLELMGCFEECLSLHCRHRVKQVDEQYLRDEFNAADGDGNGVLDVDELNELLKKMGYITDATWSTKDTNKR